MNVYFSPIAAQKLIKLSTYLLENWNKKVRDAFVEKLKNKMQQISIYPQSCNESKTTKGLFKCVVTKQTTIYYRIHEAKQEIEVVTLFDTRQHPVKLTKHLK
ncbi:type II toxin-antitoxin system RelE/ParE family toxin [Lacinutrix sp. WUR7]|uniref:type II toxin-antitoxin system RelE/ParE family toxin n=1 Tax=Lacinutrix sp. WUR7 TaxID=2653681 RepID=UPI00193C9C44|nr:type II toxin-antitoxin system RelE/ParE family toxin [Lacinutrix sp. WUR7]QRM88285.1 type II toxin-antitoxin system RelE/ParE family toxin [Lacinutrix sp. WUR7]